MTLLALRCSFAFSTIILIKSSGCGSIGGGGGGGGSNFIGVGS